MFKSLYGKAKRFYFDCSGMEGSEIMHAIMFKVLNLNDSKEFSCE